MAPKTPASFPTRKRRRVKISRIPADIGLFSMGFVPPQFESKPLVAKRPTSQAAAMAAEPTADQIETLIMFTSCSADNARRFLKVKHNDIEAAANAIMEGESIVALEKATGWDESLHSADRDGNPDANLRPLGASAAPTRGNSPARSLHPNNRDEEDGQLAAALAASQGDLVMGSYQQETGIVNSDGGSVMFGPAQQGKDYHNYAMVKSSEVVQDVEIEDRVQAREAPEPRLLKHLSDGDYTPNLLTICHAIPRAREALLLRSHVRENYGQDPRWWSGNTIQMPTIVHIADGTPAEPDSDKEDEFIAEVQRLMAWFDCSDRVYASTGALTATDLIKEKETTSSTLLESFLESWSDAAETKQGDNANFAGLFTSKVGTSAESGMITPNMMVVDLTVTTPEGQKKDLSELLDDLLWDADTVDPNDNDMADRYIERSADVLVMRLQHSKTSSQTQLGIEVPAILHLDKYLEENVEYSRETRQQMKQHRQRVSKIEAIEGKLQKWQHPQKSTQLEAGELLRHSLNHFSGQNRRDAENNDSTEPEPPSEAYAAITAQLNQVIESISDKLDKLAEEKERTRTLIAEISKAPPANLQQSGGLKHPYTLRGVATKPNITYVLLPKHSTAAPPSPPSNDILLDSSSTTPQDMQWWRLDYDSSTLHPRIIRTPAEDYDVLRAVELEHNSALLVYASDAATSFENYNPHLPQPLVDFVNRDNALFQSDLAAARRPRPRPRPDSVTSFTEVREITDDADEWEHVKHSIEPQHNRRGSISSMIVDRGDGDSPGPPGYDDHHHGHVGGASAGGRYDSYGRPEDHVHEIHLEPSVGGRSDVEMVEREQHEPLTLARNAGVAGSDMEMGGTQSQDEGIGGAVHVEDAAEMK